MGYRRREKNARAFHDPYRVLGVSSSRASGTSAGGAGHDVAFAVAQSDCSMIEIVGFAFAAGYDWHNNALERLYKTVKDLQGKENVSGLRDVSEPS
jgi:hypothetical protein